MDLTKILKDVPIGTELRCLLFKDPVTLYSVTPSAAYPISVKTSVGERIFLSKEGYYSRATASQNCMIYPPMMNSWHNVEYIPDGKLVVYEKHGKIIQIGCAKGGWGCKNTLRLAVHWWYDLESHKLDVDSRFYFDRQATEYECANIYNLLIKEGYEMVGTELKLVFKFKEGDIIVNRMGIIAIFDHADSDNTVVYKAIRRINGEIVVKTDIGIGHVHWCRLATEEEKNLFFNSLAEAGYFWDGKNITQTFKKGDVIVTDTGIIALFDHFENGSRPDVIAYNAILCTDGTLMVAVKTDIGYASNARLAIEEERNKLFDALARVGYHWNGEEMVLSFKKGDIVVSNYGISIVDHIGDLGSQKDVIYYQACIDIQNELQIRVDCGVGRVSNNKLASSGDKAKILIMLDKAGYKFDGVNVIPKKYEFTPFEKVLVRDKNTDNWKCDFFSYTIENGAFPFRCVGYFYSQCIPYNEETKHLVGTTDMPPKKYIIWE